MIHDIEQHQVLGEGGSATVYDVQRDGAALAVKVLHRELSLSPRECARFQEEVDRMRRVLHPGLVPVIEGGLLPDGRPYIAMPRLTGETLAHRLLRGPLPLAEAIALFDELCSALTALHEGGLVHRDIKPENIFLVSEPGRGVHPVLLDLGIARDVSRAIHDDVGRAVARDARVHGPGAVLRSSGHVRVRHL